MQIIFLTDIFIWKQVTKMYTQHNNSGVFTKIWPLISVNGASDIRPVWCQ